MLKIISIIIAALAVTSGLILLLNRPDGAVVEVGKGKPLMEVESGEMVKDLGRMKVDEERSAEFVLTNNGSGPLKIFNPYTSCMCTFGQIIIGDKKSPEFGMAMHGNPSWQGVLEPGKIAIAKVIYKPYLMPVQGLVERSFIFKTNDSLNSEVNLTVRAIVE